MTARRPPRLDPAAPPLRRMLALALLHAMNDYWVPKERTERRILRGELAERVGVSSETVGIWLRAERDIPTERLHQLCTALEVEPARLLCWAAASAPGWEPTPPPIGWAEVPCDRAELAALECDGVRASIMDFGAVGATKGDADVEVPDDVAAWLRQRGSEALEGQADRTEPPVWGRVTDQGTKGPNGEPWEASVRGLQAIGWDESREDAIARLWRIDTAISGGQ